MRNRLLALWGRTRQILTVLWTIIWRGFGLFLYLCGASAGVGAAITGSWVNGVVIAWSTIMIGIIGAIGYAIATTGGASTDTVAKATQDAIQKIHEQPQQ